MSIEIHDPITLATLLALHPEGGVLVTRTYISDGREASCVVRYCNRHAVARYQAYQESQAITKILYPTIDQVLDTFAFVEYTDHRVCPWCDV